MRTTHRILIADSRSLGEVPTESVDLVVTSPPYPMIEMWDGTFTAKDGSIGEALDRGDGRAAFDMMHLQLDRVWAECYRVLKPGGWACINVGDATRKIGGEFQLFPNHARVITAMNRIGLTVLPDVLWRKPNNSPTKFMGSGMLPSGAYVTYEHEYILIFRKGEKREFRREGEKANRRRSAFFWEERGVWFSDIWMHLTGTNQILAASGPRNRSGAFPVEVPYRLIQMYSVLGDTVLDPFLGTGSTSLAAAVSGRNSVGVEIDRSFSEIIEATLSSAVSVGRERAEERLRDHMAFVLERGARGKPLKYLNRHYDVPVVSAQETDLVLYRPKRVRAISKGQFEVEHIPAELESQLMIAPD